MAVDKYGMYIESKGKSMRGGDPFGYKQAFENENKIGVKSEEHKRNGCICDNGGKRYTPSFPTKDNVEISL